MRLRLRRLGGCSREQLGAYLASSKALGVSGGLGSRQASCGDPRKCFCWPASVGPPGPSSCLRILELGLRIPCFIHLACSTPKIPKTQTVWARLARLSVDLPRTGRCPLRARGRRPALGCPSAVLHLFARNQPLLRLCVALTI